MVGEKNMANQSEFGTPTIADFNFCFVFFLYIKLLREMFTIILRTLV